MFRILLIICVLFPCVVLGQDQINQQSTSDNDQTSENVPPIERGEILSLLRDLISVLDYYSRETAKENYPNDLEQASLRNAREDIIEQRRMAFATEDMALYAFIAIVLTLVALAFLWGTLRYTKRAAESSEATLDVVRDTSSRELRAYMTQAAHHLFPTEGAEGGGILRMNFTNSGATPAQDVRMQAGAIQAIPSDPSIPEFDVIDRLFSDHPTQVGKGGGIGASIPLADKLIKSIYAGKVVYYVHGAVLYTDIYGRMFVNQLTGKVILIHTATSESGDRQFKSNIQTIGPQNCENWIACCYPRTESD